MDAFDADVLIYAVTPDHTLGRRVRRLFAEAPRRHAASEWCCCREVRLAKAALRNGSLPAEIARARETARAGRGRPAAPADPPSSRAAPPDPPRSDWPTNLGTDLYHLADLPSGWTVCTTTSAASAPTRRRLASGPTRDVAVGTRETVLDPSR